MENSVWAAYEALIALAFSCALQGDTEMYERHTEAARDMLALVG
jgi:hypothetical protein